MIPRRCLLAAGVAWLLALGVSAGPAHAGSVVTLGSVSFTGSQSHTARIQRDFIASTCAAPKQFVHLTDTGSTFRYNGLNFTSRLMDPVCVTVDVNTSCASVFSSAYLGPFDATDPRIRWAADPGDFGTPPYSLTVPAGGSFTVVVSEIAACAAGYSLAVGSNGPWATTAPAVNGPAAVGRVLTGVDAGWTAAPSQLERRWVRCDAAGNNCVEIAGATGSTYTVAEADVGHTLRFRNHATDASGASRSQSVPVEAFITFADHPSESLATGDSVHSGIFVRNSIESRCTAPTAVPAVLSEFSTFFYDPYAVRSLLNEPVCLVAHTVPSCFGGTTTEIYDPGFDPALGLAANYAANSGQNPNLPGIVSNTVPGGGAREVLVSRGPFGGSCATYGVTIGTDAPFASARPAVSGNAVEGGALTATDGSWSGTPALAHSWLRCDAAGAACAPIPGATGASYTPTAADAGSRLRARVTATQGRSVSSDSEPSGVVAPGAGSSADVTPPRLGARLGSRNLRRAVRTGRVPVVIACDEACSGHVQLKVTRRLAKRMKLRKLVIARASGTVAAGQPKTLRAKLTRAARRAMRARRALRLSIVAKFADAAGNSSRITRKAALERPRRR